jgi:hypothetical protein
MAMLSWQTASVKRASSPVVRCAARAGTPAPRFLPVEHHSSWSSFGSIFYVGPAPLMAMLSWQTAIVKRESSPVVQCGARAGTPAQHFFASRTSRFLEPASQPSSTLAQPPLMAMLSWQTAIVKRESSPVVQCGARGGTPVRLGWQNNHRTDTKTRRLWKELERTLELLPKTAHAERN